MTDEELLDVKDFILSLPEDAKACVEIFIDNSDIGTIDIKDFLTISKAILATFDPDLKNKLALSKLHILQKKYALSNVEKTYSLV